MSVKFSEDVVPLSDLKINPGKVIGRVQESHRPMLLTSRGRGVAVVQGLEDYEKTAEELRFVKAVAQGLMDAREGDTVSVGKRETPWVLSKWSYVSPVPLLRTCKRFRPITRMKGCRTSAMSLSPLFWTIRRYCGVILMRVE